MKLADAKLVRQALLGPEYKSVEDLRAAMRNYPENFDGENEYVLIEAKPVLSLIETKKSNVKESTL